MSLSKKVALNTIIQVAGKIVSTVIGLFTIAILTRYLGQAGFGEYTTAITFLSFFAVVADLGLTLVTVQMISSPRFRSDEAGLVANDQNRMLGNLLGLRLISALILLGAAPAAVLFFPYSAAVKAAVAVASLSFFFIALNQILVGLFQKNLRLDRVSIAEVAGRIALLAGIFFVAYLDLGLLGVMIVTSISSAINFLLHFVFSKKLAKISLKFDISAWREIMARAWPIGLTIVFNLIYLRTDTLILSLVKTQAEVGIYGATYKVIDVLITLPFIFAGIVLPILTASWQNDKERFSRIVQRSFNFMAILALPLAVGTQFIAVRVMTLVAGNDFATAGLVLKILIFAAAIIFPGTIFSHAIIAIDRQKKIIKTYAFTAASSLTGYLIFIPLYSYYGAAWVTIYSELTIALSGAYLVWKYSRFRPHFGVFFKAAAAALAMALLLYALPPVNLLLEVAIAALAYFFLLYLFGGVTKDELRELLGPNN